MTAQTERKNEVLPQYFEKQGSVLIKNRPYFYVKIKLKEIFTVFLYFPLSVFVILL